MVSKLLTFITGRQYPLKNRIYARPQTIKQARRPDFYKYTRLPRRDPLGQIKSKF